KKGSREKYQAILTKVPDVEPEAYYQSNMPESSVSNPDKLHL
ncbi:MAG: toxin-antitoxin system HicB family antitoxin, partial [Microcystis sp.]